MDPNASTAASQPRMELGTQPPSDSEHHSGRSRAKPALLTWAGAYALILGVLAVGGPAMASWPLALRALVLSGLIVAAMTWVIVPVMTRLFRGWLAR
jgi:antibiotic biosynthesis monooxygenase (ABM) superfamily enzyme